jgi:RloB-like protein
MPASRAQFALRKKRSYMDRVMDVIEPRQRFLIVCEGAKTEPQYFKKFRVPGLVIQVEGTGMNTQSLVNEAVSLWKADEYDQVWCVFDKDDNPIDQFENAIQSAVDRGMHTAYSNQAFELWYVLHFEYLNSGIDRKAYMRKLDHYLKIKYRKNDPDIYQKLINNMDAAIINSEKLLAQYRPSRPGLDDPATTVHELVKVLREQAKPLR